MLRQVGFKAINGMKLAGAGIVSICIGEAAFLGARMAQSDVLFVGNGVKECVKPTPVKIRKGFKKQVVKRNPFTGKLSIYNGDSKPVNKKAVKVNALVK